MSDKVDWQVTATTIHCNFVGDFASLLVYGDGTAKCAYFNKWNARKEGARKLEGCKGLEQCPNLADFKENALSM